MRVETLASQATNIHNTTSTGVCFSSSYLLSMWKWSSVKTQHVPNPHMRFFPLISWSNFLLFAIFLSSFPYNSGSFSLSPDFLAFLLLCGLAWYHRSLSHRGGVKTETLKSCKVPLPWLDCTRYKEGICRLISCAHPATELSCAQVQRQGDVAVDKQ